MKQLLRDEARHCVIAIETNFPQYYLFSILYLMAGRLMNKENPYQNPVTKMQLEGDENVWFFFASSIAYMSKTVNSLNFLNM